ILARLERALPRAEADELGRRQRHRAQGHVPRHALPDQARRLIPEIAAAEGGRAAGHRELDACVVEDLRDVADDVLPGAGILFDVLERWPEDHRYFPLGEVLRR